MKIATGYGIILRDVYDSRVYDLAANAWHRAKGRIVFGARGSFIDIVIGDFLFTANRFYVLIRVVDPANRGARLKGGFMLYAR